MDDITKERILASWLRLPEELRSPTASEEQLREFETRFGPIPADFRWFLGVLGGGPVGSEWVNDIRELWTTHERFAQESALPRGWTMKGVFVIGYDGAANPFGIEVTTGRLLVEDHFFGGIHEMAPSFEDFLVRGVAPNDD